MVKLTLVVPQDTWGRILTFLVLLFVLGWYMLRLSADVILLNAGLGLGFLLAALAPVILLIAMVVFGFVLGVLWYCASRRQPTLLVLLVVGGLLAGMFPLPPTPEQRSFAKYRQDYEAVVALAQQQRLAAEGGCTHLPPRYAHIASKPNNCIYVGQEEGLIVEFTPRNFYRPIVFANSFQLLKMHASAYGGDGVMVKQLAEHWYLCNRDFN